uniref:Stomatin like 3 n=1 Tax=Pelusios castaneus TaxID=367368 RepID=A0A8C8VN15_9SAUR
PANLYAHIELQARAMSSSNSNSGATQILTDNHMHNFWYIYFDMSMVIKEYERAVIFRLGRIVSKRAKGPGLIFILPCTDIFTRVDLRTVSCNIPPQEVTTVQRASSKHVGLYRKEDGNILSTSSLQSLLSILDNATDKWGIKVARVEIKDVRIPMEMQRSMAAEAEATREARAKVRSTSEGEMNASKALKQASTVLIEAPAALQLRYLQTLTTLATEKNSTIVFPLPMTLLQGFCNHKRKTNSN